MPPALVVLGLVAVGVPAALHAATGRPRTLVAGWIAAATGATGGQVLGDLLGWRVGLLGDAQLLAAVFGAICASLAIATLERRKR